jgi:hypothetical protein
MTDSCVTCKAWLRLERVHAGECPVRAGAYCTHCSCMGHIATECDDRRVMVDRPATLEELIPEEVRTRWGIDTRTDIAWPAKTALIDLEEQIAESNTIEIRYSVGAGREAGLDARLRQFMKTHRIVNSAGHTEHATNANLLKLREWAVAQGKKVRLVEE